MTGLLVVFAMLALLSVGCLFEWAGVEVDEEPCDG